MISYLEIEAESLRAGVSAATIEKDYHLDWYLAALASEDFFKPYLFYGGTAIKKLYVPRHRYSEDLDFISWEHLEIPKIQKGLERLHARLEKNANLFYFLEPRETSTLGTQTRFWIHYRGFSEIGGIKRFLLDFAQGIEGLPRPVSRKLMTSYRDLKKGKILIRAMSLETILGEKLALIVDRKRKEPRDIYDLWSALMFYEGLNKKTFVERYEKALGYRTRFSIIRSTLRDPDYKRAWEIRLRHQVPALPDYEVVVLELMNKLGECFAKQSA